MIIPLNQERLLYPEILWERPLNIYRTKGQVFVLAGKKQNSPLFAFCEVIYQLKFPQIKIGLPEHYCRKLKGLLPAEILLPLPATKFDTFASITVPYITKEAKHSQLLVLGIGMDEDSQLEEIIKQLLLLPCDIIFINEGIIQEKSFYQNHPAFSLYFLDPQKMGQWINAKETTVLENPLFAISQLQEKLNSRELVVLSLPEKNFIFDQGQTVLTKTENKNLFLLLALTTAFWSQNHQKPFQSAVTAAYVTRVFTENHHQIGEINQIIEQIGEGNET